MGWQPLSKKTINKRTNELTNHKRESKNKQTNKQTTSKDDSQFPCNCKVYYFMKIWFHFFNVGYGVFGFLDHPLSPFYLIKWLNVTPKYLWLLLFIKLEHAFTISSIYTCFSARWPQLQKTINGTTWTPREARSKR